MNTADVGTMYRLITIISIHHNAPGEGFRRPLIYANVVDRDLVGVLEELPATEPSSQASADPASKTDGIFIMQRSFSSSTLSPDCILQARAPCIDFSMAWMLEAEPSTRRTGSSAYNVGVDDCSERHCPSAKGVSERTAKRNLEAAVLKRAMRSRLLNFEATIKEDATN